MPGAADTSTQLPTIVWLQQPLNSMRLVTCQKETELLPVQRVEGV